MSRVITMPNQRRVSPFDHARLKAVRNTALKLRQYARLRLNIYDDGIRVTLGFRNI
jgi:hypothetical protein